MKRFLWWQLLKKKYFQVEENPFKVTCQHGVKECMGNAMHACFFARHNNNEEQVKFGVCTMSTKNPPTSGEMV